ncbi:MAG: hypothetical protein JXA30_20230 [Deltaproteobacteria bacterium]|nr:hypothetical protein [Deltaproteobacteria bacterium]
MVEQIKERMLHDLKELFIEILGEDFDHEDITPETSLIYDLGLESLEFIAVLDAIHQRYGVLLQIAQEDGEVDSRFLDKLTVGFLIEQLPLTLKKTS